MISRIELQNFQSHKSSELLLSPGVNVIVGPSDSGKSAIIRALRWLVWNRPQGDAFRSVWGGITAVVLNTDKHSIIRRKQPQGNSYFLQTYGGAIKDIEFKAFSTEIPEEIVSSLNLNDINLQQQLDRPFLLDSTPGEVAQHFNQIAHLDIIDTGIQAVARWVRELEQDIRVAISHKEELEEKLKQYAHLDEFETEVKVLETMETDCVKLQSNSYKLLTHISLIQKIQEQVDNSSKILQAEDTVNSVLGLMENRRETVLKSSKLDRFISDFISCQSALKAHQDYANMEKPVDDILAFIYKRVEKLEEVNNLFRAQSQIMNAEGELSGEEFNLKQLEELFKKNMPDICPLCGQEVKKCQNMKERECKELRDDKN